MAAPSPLRRRVIIAPDSFKGSLSAADVASTIGDGWREERPDDDLIQLPQADGGEGTLDAIARAVPESVRRSTGSVTGPDGRPTPGAWLHLPDGTAVVELAQSSGLPLMASRDAGGATTRGLGEVIRSALSSGATDLVIGLGGSASTDGGAGALRALGLRLLDADGDDIPEGGAGLIRLATIDRSELLAPPARVTLLTDVTAPLLGPAGAASVFGPQKGATPEDVIALDAGLAHLAEVLGGDPDAPGAGAAGGTAYGFATVWGAEIVPGAARIAELSGLAAAIPSADLVITGEGRFDAQSLGGKVVGGVLALGRDAGVRVAVIAGQLGADPGVWAVSLSELAGSTEEGLAEPARWLREAGARAAREVS